MVPAARYQELMSKPVETIFALIVLRHGEKLANELAAELLQNKPMPPVTWPRLS